MSRRDRRLSLAEVASLMKLEHASERERRRYVRRLIRRLEIRDQTRYLHRDSPKGKLYIPLSAIERLMPWDPGTLAALRGNVDALGVRIKRVERRVTKHDQHIQKLHEWQSRSVQLLQEIATYEGPKGAKKGAAPTA